MRSSVRMFLSVLPLIAIAGASASFMGAAPAMAKANAGTLTCTVSPSQLQSDIAAKANLSCRFDPIAGPKAKLTGTVNRSACVKSAIQNSCWYGLSWHQKQTFQLMTSPESTRGLSRAVP